MPFALPGQAILTRGGRRVVSGPAEASKTYADFVAHINTLTPTTVAWGNPIRVGSFRTYGSATHGGWLWGSPWGPGASTGIVQVTAGVGQETTVNRVVRHSLPSESEYFNQAGSSRQVLLTISSEGNLPWSYGEYTRNGITASAITAEYYAAVKVDQVLYWDGTQAMRMQPSLGLGPVPYTW